MEKKTMESLRAMLCKEIEDIAQKGNLTHESLDFPYIFLRFNKVF